MEKSNDNPETGLVPVSQIQTAIACAAQINIDATDLTAVQTMMMEMELERQVKELMQQLKITEQTGADTSEGLRKALEQLPERYTEQAAELQARLAGFEEAVLVTVTVTLNNDTLVGSADFEVKTEGHYGSLNLTQKIKLAANDPLGRLIKERTQTIRQMDERTTEIRREIAQRRKTLGNFDRIERMARGQISLGLLKNTPQGQQLLAQLGFNADQFEASTRDVLKGVIG